MEDPSPTPNFWDKGFVVVVVVVPHISRICNFCSVFLFFY